MEKLGKETNGLRFWKSLQFLLLLNSHRPGIFLHAQSRSRCSKWGNELTLFHCAKASKYMLPKKEEN
ncbi:hypothetical protein ACTXT7_002437 [Hymenolepis weldensis]